MSMLLCLGIKTWFTSHIVTNAEKYHPISEILVTYNTVGQYEGQLDSIKRERQKDLLTIFTEKDTIMEDRGQQIFLP